MSFGSTMGWSNATTRSCIDARQEFGDLASKVELSWIVSIGPLGGALGVIIWSYSNVKTGPKKTMMVQDVLLCITWILLALVDKIPMKLAGRFFSHFLAISLKVCGETLLVDSVHKLNLRPMFVVYKSCTYLGVLLSFIIGYKLPEMSFALINCGLVSIHLTLLMFCPESPVFLYQKSIKKAEEAIIWYRGPDNIYLDIRNLRKDSENRRADLASYKYMLYSKTVTRATVILMGVGAGKAFSGYYIFLYYNAAIVRIFSNIEMNYAFNVTLQFNEDVVSRDVDSILIGVMMFSCMLVSTWVHFYKVFNVKWPLLVSSLGCTITLSLLATFLYLEDEEYDLILGCRWIYLMLIFLLFVSYDIGFNCCPDRLLLAYIPYQVFPTVRLIITFTMWFLIFVVCKLYFILSNWIKGWLTMVTLSIISFTWFIFMCWFVIEPRNKTLMQIQMEIGGNPVGSRGTRQHQFAIG